jgi:hypothetical protein
VICRDRGRILYQSDMADLDEISEEDLDPEKTIEIPHKNDLGLGQDLVFQFVGSRLPDAYDRVRRMFRKRGAYARYKELLASRRLLQECYDFENAEERKALRQWCADNEIDVEE